MQHEGNQPEHLWAGSRHADAGGPTGGTKSASAAPPPGWYQDPHNPAGQRWWDGYQWTDHAAPAAPVYAAAQPAAWQGLTLAGWWSRVGAAILDWLIIAVPGFIVGIVIGAASPSTDNGVLEFELLSAAIGLVIAFVYCLLTMGRDGQHNGQTIGMQATGIRVVRTDGRQVDFGTILLRQTLVQNVLFGWVCAFLLYIPTLLNYLWPLWDRENRALHDMMCSTRVIRA